MSRSKNAVTSDTSDERESPCDDFLIDSGGCNIRLGNVNILSNLESNVSHLEPSKQNEFIALL